jgi:hypothetical protein
LLAVAHASPARSLRPRAYRIVIGPEIQAMPAACRYLLEQLASAAHRSGSYPLRHRLELAVTSLPSVAGKRAGAIGPLGALIDALATLERGLGRGVGNREGCSLRVARSFQKRRDFIGCAFTAPR